MVDERGLVGNVGKETAGELEEEFNGEVEEVIGTTDVEGSRDIPVDCVSIQSEQRTDCCWRLDDARVETRSRDRMTINTGNSENQ